jgi:outer membrane receptor protein involved in Fe transport
MFRTAVMKMTNLALCLAVVGMVSGTMRAQSTTQGAIGGVVEDATGAVVSGATVTIHNDATNSTTTVTSDASGNFIAPLIEPGTYTVSITAAGFDTVAEKSVAVQVGQLTTLLPHLASGSSSTTVEVTSEAPVLNFEAPDFSTVLNQAAMANIPVNNRRWSALALTTPGVVPDSSGFGLVSVRGISTILNNVEIDGADDNQAYYAEERGRTREGYSTSGSAVREFQVNTGVYQAEYGRAAGGVINSVTKSGGNGFHGQIYGYDRESKWNAYNDYTTQTVLVNGVNTTIHLKPEDLRKIYGFTVGGPLIKDKLFWMYTYDQHSHIFPAIATPSTPSNFYLTPEATASGTEACNTTTGQMTGTNSAGTAVSTPDQEVCLMAARLSAAGYAAFGGGNTGYAAAASLFTTDLNNLNSQDLGTITRAGYQEINTPKLDWQINPKEHVSVLYHRLRWDSPGGVQTQNPVFYGIDTTGTDFVKLDYGVAKLTSLISSNISNEVLYQYGRELNDEGQTPYSTYTTNNLVGPTGNVPEVVFSSTGGGLTFGSPYYSYRKALPDERKWQLEDTLYYSRGNHTFKFGVDLLHNADLINNTFESNGVYTYGYQSNYFTDLYLSQHSYTGTGVCNASASQVYAAGAVGTAPCYSSYVQGYGNPIFGIATLDYGVFAQDNWKLTPQLTLELGLRYDQELLPTQQTSYVNPAEIVGGVAVGANHPSDKNNFGPRVGFSYDLFGKGKSVLRGGFGMYYGRLTNGIILNALLNTGYGPAQYTTSFNSTASSAVPAGPKFPNVAPATAGVAISPSVEYLDAHLQNPLVEEFDLVMQQELGKGTVFSLSYLGALGKELTNFLDLNLNPNTKETVTVNVVDSTGKGPLGPTGTQIPVSVFTSYNTTGTSFGAITDVISNINSNYNALVAEVQNHSLHSLQFDVNYTWAHALDYNQNTTTTTSTTNWLDPYSNPRANYGNGSYNVPNRVVAWGLYNLPKFVASKNWASYVVNGWSIDDSLTGSSGLPLSITVSGNVASNKVLGGWNGGGDTQYIPNIGRNTIKYPRHIVDDARVQKQIDFTERYNMQLFVNIFNIANHQNIDGLNTTGYAFTNGTTSSVTATYQTTLQTVTSSNSSGFLFTPREIEIGAKLSF